MMISPTHRNSAAPGLTTLEVSRIEEAAEAIEGWTAIAFDCGCCGKTTAQVFPICEATKSPTFEISRKGSKILLTTTWLDEFRSMPAALGAMRATIATAASETANATK